MASPRIAAGGGRFSETSQPLCYSQGEKARPSRDLLSLRCPHCRERARIRSSRDVTPIFREYRLQCTNVECGHTYVAALSVERTIVQSAQPDPRIKLPLAQPRGALAPRGA